MHHAHRLHALAVPGQEVRHGAVDQGRECLAAGGVAAGAAAGVEGTMAPGPPGTRPGPAAAAAVAAAASVAERIECALKMRVGENSPSLCPTMFSVT